MPIEVDLGSVIGPPGPTGETGPTGSPGAAATIQLGTVQSGQEADITNSGDNHNAIFNFVLPIGPPGQDGQNGTDGADGQDGAPGAAATIEVGDVTSGSTAQVSNSGTPNAAVFDFVLPVGPKGEAGADGADGEQGPPGTSATIQIGSVTSGDAAQVTNSGTANAAVLNFVLPRGPAGQDGADGVDGARGPAGTAATIQVGTVTSGDTASVTNVGTSSAARFNFVLPKGDKGDQGEQGEPGVAGQRGPQGVQGPAGADGKTPSFQIKSDGHLYAIWED